jgi:hypothetical protein
MFYLSINNLLFSEMQFNISFNVLKGSYVSVESSLYNINTKIEYPCSVTHHLPSIAVTNSSKYVLLISSLQNIAHTNSREHNHFLIS